MSPHLIVLALAAVAGLVFSGVFKTGVDFIDNLEFQFNPLQIPSVSKGNFEFPVTVSVINPSSITMPLDSVFASLYKKEGTGWKYLGSSQPDLTDVQIKANATSKLNFKIKIPLLSAAAEIPGVFNVVKDGITDIFGKNTATDTPSETAQLAKSTYKIEAKIVIEGHQVTQNFETTV